VRGHVQRVVGVNFLFDETRLRPNAAPVFYYEHFVCPGDPYSSYGNAKSESAARWVPLSLSCYRPEDGVPRALIAGPLSLRNAPLTDSASAHPSGAHHSVPSVSEGPPFRRDEAIESSSPISLFVLLLERWYWLVLDLILEGDLRLVRARLPSVRIWRRRHGGLLRLDRTDFF